MTMTSAEKLRLWKDHPAAMVRDLFGVEPDLWQVEALEAFPHHPQQAFKAAKGCGKSTCLAWLCWNFLLTRPHAKVGAVSITRDNLADGLWAEMSKWQQRAPVLARAFTWQRDRIFCNDAPSTWFMSAKSYAKDASEDQQANTLAGFHADFVMFVLDEVGGMSDAVMVAAEAARSGCVECHIVAAGNPTHLSGPLYRAATVDRNKPWWVAEITGDPDNPKRSSRIPVDWAAEQIARYGRDNPFVMVNVLGEFPPSSLNALIGPEEVEQAMSRSCREEDIRTAPRILGVDVAQFGDDASCIVLRRGLQAFRPRQERNLSSTDGAAVVSAEWNRTDADAVFIDSTGGYGAGWIDRLRELGRAPIGVQFAGRATESERYFNKRAEMYLDVVEWIRRGGALWRSERLKAALTQTTYSFKGGRLLLEPKEQVKNRLGYSPDEADALALTFAADVAARELPRQRGRPMQVEYDPFASITDAMDRAGGCIVEYDPFKSGW